MPTKRSTPPTTHAEDGHADTRREAEVPTVRCALGNDTTMRIGSDQPPRPSPGRGAERYIDEYQVAQGGMAEISAAFDRVIQRRVAVKTHDRERDPRGLAQFVEEAQITGQLDHPNIVPVYDLLSDPSGVPTRFTMKLIDGVTLADRIDALPSGDIAAQDLEDLLQIFMRVCDAVSFAHARGVIHRDLKPSNIMVGLHGQVYLVDWGVALLLDQRRPSEELAGRETWPVGQDRTGPLSGTPAYMAPEQARGRAAEIDARTDVYGLGGVLYSMLTGLAPHESEDPGEALARARVGDVPDPRQQVPGRTLPPGLCRIAARALSPDKAQRYPTAEALKQDVEAFLRGGGWFETLRIPQGETVVEEGDEAAAAYIITEGTCQLFRGSGAQRQFLRMLGPGDVFGETAIFGATTRTASVVAGSDVQLVKVTRDALERELSRTEWLRSFVEALAERYLELDERLRRLERDAD